MIALPSLRHSLRSAVAAAALLVAAPAAAQTGGLSSSLDDVLGPARPPVSAADPQPLSEVLFLTVVLNGRDTGALVEAVPDPATGGLAVRADDLRAAGIRPPAGAGGLVALSAIPGAVVEVDRLAQVLRVTASDIALMPRVLRPRRPAEILPAETGFGLALNYRLTADLGNDIFGRGPEPGSGYLALDGRVFLPLGVLRTTAGLSFTDFSADAATLRRFDTTFTVAMPRRAMVLVLGDMVTSGPSWARPVRMGGVQLRRDFSLRDDLVTAPALTFAGSAAVPSTVDVYVGSIRAYTGTVEPGPFVITDLPFVTSDGTAEVVIRDAAGNEQVTRVPFFATRDLVRDGVFDFALQVGRLREGFGTENFGYGDTTAGVASLRYGLTDRLTLEAHLEGNRDVLVAGVGIATVLFDRAELALSAGTSRQGEARGEVVEARLRTAIGPVDLSLSTRRTFGDFRDLAYVSAVEALGAAATAEDLAALRPADVLDVVSLGMPLWGDRASLGVSFINAERGDTRDRILSASYAQRIGPRGASFRVSGFRTLDGEGDYGLSLGLSMQLGGQRSGSFGVTRGRDGATLASVGLARPLGSRVGATGYSLTLNDGGDRLGDLRVAHNTRFGRAEFWAYESGGAVAAQVGFDGAIVVMGGGIFAAPAIADAFAIVDVGLPGVGVSLQNRPVTVTGASGRAIVTGLRSYRRNRIALDLGDDLPLDLGIAATARDIVPTLNAGVAVDFAAGSGRSALVVLRTPEGAFVEAGSVAVLNGRGEEAFVGYDGLVWLTDLRDENRLAVTTLGRSCTATFAFVPRPGEQQIIEPVECRP